MNIYMKMTRSTTSTANRRARQVCMGDWTIIPARAALDFSFPLKMRNIIEISKLERIMINGDVLVTM